MQKTLIIGVINGILCAGIIYFEWIPSFLSKMSIALPTGVVTSMAASSIATYMHKKNSDSVYSSAKIFSLTIIGLALFLGFYLWHLSIMKHDGVEPYDHLFGYTTFIFLIIIGFIFISLLELYLHSLIKRKNGKDEKEIIKPCLSSNTAQEAILLLNLNQWDEVFDKLSNTCLNNEFEYNQIRDDYLGGEVPQNRLAKRMKTLVKKWQRKDDESQVKAVL